MSGPITWSEAALRLFGAGFAAAERFVAGALGHVAANPLPEFAVFFFLALPGPTGEVEVPAIFRLGQREVVRALVAVLVHSHQPTMPPCAPRYRPLQVSDLPSPP